MARKIRVWSTDSRQIVDAILIEPCDSPHYANFWDFLCPLYKQDKIDRNTYKLLMERFKIREKYARDAINWFNNI